MTKKELAALMAEIQEEQAKAKEESVTKEDIKSLMAEMLKGNKSKVVEEEVVEKVEEDKQLDKEDMKDFIKGFENKKEDKDLSSMSFKGLNGETIPMFKDKNDKKGFGF